MARYFHDLHNEKGFTIVELLIVIVIIGILAAISIVAYSGITSRAVAASVESDLANASKKIKMFYAENSVYPTSISDCPLPSSQNLCLKPSSGNSFNYSPIGSSNFYLKSTNTNGVSYYTNNDSSPSKLATAPMNPTSDWVVVPQGDHYGNFYNLISGQFATVNRVTDSTIYDAATERIYTVPANYLGANYKNSNGKKGYEATIEDPKTNYVLRSSFENSMAGWTYQFNGYGGAELSSVRSVHGSKSLAVSRTIEGAEANVYYPLSGLSSSTTYYYSAWTWASSPNSACLYTYNSTTSLATVCNSGNSKWERIGGTFVSSATGNVQLRLGNVSTAGTVGYFDAIQVEQGNYPTSYIFTEDTIASRNSSIVTIPTVSSFSGGTVVASIDNAVRSNVGVYTFGLSYANNIAHYANTPTSIQSVFYNASAESYASIAGPYSGGGIAAWRWNSTGSKQTINNTHSSLGGITAPTGTATSTYLGCFFGGSGCFGAPIQRIITYSTFLSDSDVTSITNSIKDGI